MGLQPTVDSADLFKERGEHLLFLERIFHLTCLWAPLSPKAALESQGGHKAEDPSRFAPLVLLPETGHRGTTGTSPGGWVGWARAAGFVSARGTEGMNLSFNDQIMLHL